MPDPIIDELERLRAEQIAQLNFDFEFFFRKLKEQEKLLPQAVQPPPETAPHRRVQRPAGFTVRR